MLFLEHLLDIKIRINHIIKSLAAPQDDDDMFIKMQYNVLSSIAADAGHSLLSVKSLWMLDDPLNLLNC